MRRVLMVTCLSQGCIIIVCVQRARIYIGAYVNAPGKMGSFMFMIPFRCVDNQHFVLFEYPFLSVSELVRAAPVASHNVFQRRSAQSCAQIRRQRQKNVSRARVISRNGSRSPLPSTGCGAVPHIPRARGGQLRSSRPLRRAPVLRSRCCYLTPVAACAKRRHEGRRTVEFCDDN
jgi:hypothetical protein